MNAWTLPEAVEVNGQTFKVNADFRDILNIISHLNDDTTVEQLRVYVALALFYEEFDAIPESDYREATQRMLDFIGCGEERDTRPRIKTIDWEQDHNLIVADINRVAGCEVRSLSFCHWWTFIAWFNSIGEGQLSTVVSIREKRRTGKKLSDWERNFYHNNREKIDFKRSYTAEDDEILKEWLGG